MISVIVITREQDANDLARMIDSLPTGVEVCIVMTRQADTDSYEVHESFEEGERTFKMATWTYKHFSFSKARNYSIELATNEWLFWMDSDDYLLPMFKEEIKEFEKLPIGIGGVEVGVFGCQPAYKHGEKMGLYAIPHLRAFRKSSGARFRGLVHEQIIPQIEMTRLTIVQSSVLIAHLGYACTRETMIAKVERNIKLLSWQVAHSDYLKDYYQTMLHNQLFTLSDMKGTT